MSLSEAALNDEFTKNLRQFEAKLMQFNQRQRDVATCWITKLKATSSTYDDKKLRNVFIKFFVNYNNDGTIFDSAPFDCVPAGRTLKNFKHLLPKELMQEEQSYTVLGTPGDQPILEMFENISDQRARLFLSDQPVPKEGTIFIIIMQPIRR